jgi:hypothetical protein
VTILIGFLTAAALAEQVLCLLRALASLLVRLEKKENVDVCRNYKAVPSVTNAGIEIVFGLCFAEQLVVDKELDIDLRVWGWSSMHHPET